MGAGQLTPGKGITPRPPPGRLRRGGDRPDDLHGEGGHPGPTAISSRDRARFGGHIHGRKSAIEIKERTLMNARNPDARISDVMKLNAGA